MAQRMKLIQKQQTMTIFILLLTFPMFDEFKMILPSRPFVYLPNCCYGTNVWGIQVIIFLYTVYKFIDGVPKFKHTNPILENILLASVPNSLNHLVLVI